MPFPFRFGVVHRIDRRLFDFDHAGRWLLLCTHRGLLHTWKIDGSRAEVLPRAVVDGEVLEQVDAVLGVADGFVVGGRIGKSLGGDALRFRLPDGPCPCVLGPTFDGDWAWYYFAGAAHRRRPGEERTAEALDLSTREVHLSRGSNTRPSEPG